MPSPLLKPSELADRGRRLQATMRDIAAIAETAVIIVDKAASQTLDRLHKPC